METRVLGAAERDKSSTQKAVLVVAVGVDCTPDSEFGRPTCGYSYVDAARLMDVDSVTAALGFTSRESYSGNSQHRMNLRKRGTST